MQRTAARISLALALLASCATSPKDIRAAYVSPLLYQDFTCDQLILEMDHVGRRVSELYISLDKRAKADQAQTGVGLILFWPALFLLDGDGPEAQEYARLKGEYEAIYTQVRRKDCGNELPPSPDQIVEQLEADAKAEAEAAKNN